MKRIFFIFLFISISIYSQSPDEFSYQAIVRDGSGNLISNQTIGVQISILESSSSGNSVYVESHSLETNINGLLTLNIGTGNTISGSFSDINWGESIFYLKSEIDITGGTNYSISGTSKLVSVPYAIHAKTSGNTYKIGDNAFGGIVFWVDETGKHGLVVSKFDVSSSSRWFSGTFGNTHAKGDGLYAGRSNMNIIIAAHAAIGDDENDYSARLVNEYQTNDRDITYGDWYLPSKYELNLIYNNKSELNSVLSSISGDLLSSVNYWTSNEVSNSSANVLNFSNGNIDNALKNGSNYVRAIRSF